MRNASLAVGALGAAAATGCQSLGGGGKPLYDISLAQWSLHKTLFAKKLDALDFAKATREEFGIDAVEYVNQFFKDKANDEAYLGQLNSDRKSTRLNSSHALISYAVFCLKKKKNKKQIHERIKL